MPRVLLALGSNLGDRAAILESAAAAISELPAVRLIRASAWHSTRPIGGPAGQAEFLNGAVLVETELSPGDLLRELQLIEQRLGRERTERWAARTLDIDMLLYGDQIVDTQELRVPHPRMSFRPFVLAPAAEIASETLHPELEVSIGALWHHLQHAENEVAVCGGLFEDRYRLLDALLRVFSNIDGTLIPVFPKNPHRVREGLRIHDGELAANVIELDRFQSQLKQSFAATALPKLQVYFHLPLNELIQRVDDRGTGADRELIRRLNDEPTVANPMSRLFAGVPTLTLDPLEAHDAQLTEAVAALKAVWPDLCRPGE